MSGRLERNTEKQEEQFISWYVWRKYVQKPFMYAPLLLVRKLVMFSLFSIISFLRNAKY